MADQNVSQAFAEWLATPPADLVSIDALEFRHVAIVDPVFICNRLDGAIALGLETGENQPHEAVAFTVERVANQTTTQEEIKILCSGLDGIMLAAFEAIEQSDLTEPLTIVWRSYLIPGEIGFPQITPPPRFVVDTISLSLTTLEIRAIGPRLPNKAAGIRYVIEDFPGLRDFQ